MVDQGHSGGGSRYDCGSEQVYASNMEDENIMLHVQDQLNTKWGLLVDLSVVCNDEQGFLIQCQGFPKCAL